MTALDRGETPDPAAEDDRAREARDEASAPAGTPDGGSDAEGGGDAAAPADGDADGAGGDGQDGGTGAERAAEADADGAEAPAVSEPGSPAVSEAEAELAAQRELRERIEERKAAKKGPPAAGAKLSGPAADLLAAVRAVESGEKPGTAFFDSPASARPPAGRTGGDARTRTAVRARRAARRAIRLPRDGGLGRGGARPGRGPEDAGAPDRRDAR
ncbi:hypothetical protein GA0115249_114179 [Streptomyces sp. PpalLS-921]|nr:hypothetical protein GA0115249_114179 [Streptomyces sp. PpalLS-921]